MNYEETAKELLPYIIKAVNIGKNDLSLDLLARSLESAHLNGGLEATKRIGEKLSISEPPKEA